MTIVACSSAPAVPFLDGPVTPRDVGRSVVRLSGAEAFSLGAEVFAPLSGSITDAGKSWRRIAGHVLWRGQRVAACAYRMPAPRSYTRENMLELHLPSIPWLVSETIERLIVAGARGAQAGEFTRRAFENGRIDLAQAETVGALIRAQSAGEARVMASRLTSQSRSKFAALRDGIEELLSMVELGLDFSHEDVGVMSVDEIGAGLQALRARAVALAGQSSTDSPHTRAQLGSAELHTLLPRVTLAGPVNAGKSSLFNALLGHDAAIVSADAHTTRDVVEAILNCANTSMDSAANCVLCDTAGFGATGDELPGAAQQRANSASARTHILLLVVDGAHAAGASVIDPLKHIIAENPTATAALVWSKADLAALNAAQRADIRGKLFATPPLEFQVSSQTGAGISALRTFIATAVSSASAEHAQAGAMAEAAAAAAAQTALAALDRACAGLAAGDGEDIVAVELREALHAFWQTEGRLIRHDAITESMLDRIFSKFCIGK